MTRTLSDIIEEFETLIDDDLIHEKDMMALVVGFETETKFIFNNEPDKLAKLQTMVDVRRESYWLYEDRTKRE